MLKAELRSRIDKLRDKFWSGGISNPLTAIEQISYLIFMKRLEDLDNQHKEAAKARNEKYDSMFSGHENCRWSEWKHLPAEEMLSHVRDVVFPFIKNLKSDSETTFSENMKDAVFVIQKPSLLQESISLIDELNITSRNYDIQGDIYEYLLSKLSISGENGQFRTPRHIIRMMVKLLDPQFGQKICDPACGTGGFLIGAYQHILEINTNPESIEYDEEGGPHNIYGDKLLPKQHRILKKDTLFGFDFENTMVRIALMNMILHGIETPNIKRRDTLSKSFNQTAEYDIILTNPPFTGSIDISDINDNFKVKTTKTELLFLELFYNLLEMGGKAAVIVPNGVLFGSSNAHKQVRKMLLENSQLEAVIPMPSGVFLPYSGVGTAVLVFVKGGKTENVWFYEMKADGYSLDQKRDFIDGKGDIPDIIEKFKTKADSKQSFSVPFATIKENDYSLSVSRYKEIEHEEIEHEDPNVIINKVLKLEQEIAEEAKKLKEMIK